jgi:hypothetical protein
VPLCVRPVRHDVEELALEADVGAAATDKMTGNGRGFGFVTFDGPGPVDDIMQRRDHSIKGKEVRAGQTSLCVNVPAPGRFCGSRTRESARERHAPGVQRAIG